MRIVQVDVVAAAVVVVELLTLPGPAWAEPEQAADRRTRKAIPAQPVGVAVIMLLSKPTIRQPLEPEGQEAAVGLEVSVLLDIRLWEAMAGAA